MKKNYILFLLISIIMNTNIVFGMDFLDSETIDMTYKSILNLEEIPQSHPYSFYDYAMGFCDDINPIMSYLNSDGTYSVCINNKGKDIKIYELNSDDTISKELSFKRVSDNLGAFTKDKQGNYYLLFGMNGDTAYTLIKYKANGTESGKLDLSVEESDTTQPFHAGTCSIVEANGIISVHDGRLIDSATVKVKDISSGEAVESSFRHQGSVLFMVDTSNMKLITIDKLVASHSNNQNVIADENGDFIFVDRGDANPRGYLISKHSQSGKLLGEITPFTFKGDLKWDEYGQGFSDGNTYSQYGGIISLKDKYVLCGTYENSISGLEFSPRNVFIQFIDKSLESYEAPIYITNNRLDNTNGNIDAANPKIIAIDENQFMVVYDEYQKGINPYRNTSGSSTADRMLKTPIHTKLIVFDSTGKILQSKEINNVAQTGLPYVNNIVYNPYTDSLDWFSNQSTLLVKNSIGLKGRNTKTSINNFTDTSGLDKYKSDALNKMLQLGVLSGYSNNTIKPYANVTKAEYVCMLVRFLKLSNKGSVVQFSDIPSTHWAYNDISAALSAGIIDTKSGNMFYPNDKITLGEAVKMLFKAKGYDVDINKYPKEKYEEYLISAYGKEYYRYLGMAYYAKLIDSSQYDVFGNFGEEKEHYITRSSAAVLFNNSLNIKRIYINEVGTNKILVIENNDGSGMSTSLN